MQLKLLIHHIPPSKTNLAVGKPGGLSAAWPPMLASPSETPCLNVCDAIIPEILIFRCYATQALVKVDQGACLKA